MSETSPQAIIQGAIDFQLQNYFLVSSVALLAYDTLLTISAEVKLIWTSKVRLGTILYASTRYCTILGLVMLFVSSTVDLSISECNALSFLVSALNFLGNTSLQGILLLRAFAVSGERKWFKIPVCLLYITSIGIILTAFKYDNCTTGSLPRAIYLSNSVIALFFEFAIIMVTAYCAWSERKSLRLLTSLEEEKPPLIQFILQQGILRFIIIGVWNLTDTILREALPQVINGVDAPLEGAISTLLVCRFILNLRELSALPQGTIPNTQLSTFQAAVRRVETIINEEFGNPPLPTLPTTSEKPTSSGPESDASTAAGDDF